MALMFRPAVRSEVGLLIGIAGETSGGKTMSGMRICQGIVGRDKPFAVIDTENKRASHYAPVAGAQPDFVSTFRFDVLDFEAPYTSERYAELVKAAVDAGYKAVLLDSASHEHDGAGGYLDRQAADLAVRVERIMRSKPNSKEWEIAERVTPSSWIEPKGARRKMMQTLLACSTSIPIVFCFRAEEKVFGTKDGKLVAHNPPMWTPICGKTIPFEMTVFFMVHADRPGVPVPIKLQAQHRPLFPLDKPLNEECGKRIAEWSKGGVIAPSTATIAAHNAGIPAPTVDPYVVPDPADCITPEQVVTLEQAITGADLSLDGFKKGAGVRMLAHVRKEHWQRALDWIGKTIEARDARGRAGLV